MVGAEDIAHIEENSAVLIGKPVLRGTRISVSQVLQTLASEGSAGATLNVLNSIDPEIAMPDVFGRHPICRRSM